MTSRPEDLVKRLRPLVSPPATVVIDERSDR
jgi:hypothetical protein